MKILFDHQIFSFQQYGGVSRYFYELAQNIAVKEGNEVEIFAPLHVNEYLSLSSDICIRGKKILHFPYSSHITKGINTALTCLMVKSRKDIDIFHETYYSRSDNCPRSAKRVLTVYDMIHEKLANRFSLHDNTRKKKAYAINRADHIICISENTRRDLIELLGVPKEKTSVVYLGYGLTCDSNSIKPMGYKKPFILYVGKRDHYKNYDLMLRAYSSSQSLRSEFIIICFGGGEVTGREADLIASLNLPPDCVIHMGGDDVVLANLYASAKAFVYPSLYEGFGIPPLEAMAVGCPVVCANTGSMPEVVGDAAELFDPASESDMRAAIERVVFSPEYAARLVIKGRERIKLFSWEKCSHDTLAIYEKVLQG